MSENTKLKNDNLSGNEIIDEEDGDHDDLGRKEIDEPGCWDKTTEFIKQTIVIIYKSLNWVFNSIKTVCGCVFYPAKEQCQNCFRGIDKFLNPYKYTAVHEF